MTEIKAGTRIRVLKEDANFARVNLFDSGTVIEHGPVNLHVLMDEYRNDDSRLTRPAYKVERGFDWYIAPEHVEVISQPTPRIVAASELKVGDRVRLTETIVTEGEVKEVYPGEAADLRLLPDGSDYSDWHDIDGNVTIELLESKPKEPKFKVGDLVTTSDGALAVIVEITDDEDEPYRVWDNDNDGAWTWPEEDLTLRTAG